MLAREIYRPGIERLHVRRADLSMNEKAKCRSFKQFDYVILLIAADIIPECRIQP